MNNETLFAKKKMNNKTSLTKIEIEDYERKRQHVYQMAISFGGSAYSMYNPNIGVTAYNEYFKKLQQYNYSQYMPKLK